MTAATTEIYTLSLHDALPILQVRLPHVSRQENHVRSLRSEQQRRRGQCSRRRCCSLRREDRKSTRLNSSHTVISYAVFCLKKKKITQQDRATYSNKITPPSGP